MALVLKDRVQETTTTTGTGVITLAGATTGFQAFSAVGSGNDTYYTITDGTNWEAGTGMYANVPSPALSLDFTSTTTLDSRIALTRATSATYFDSTGTLTSATSGVARFEHYLENGVWVNKGLLIEPQRTNLSLRSQEFNDASWLKSNCTITANTTVAPDGTTTADRFRETSTANVFHEVYREVASINSTTQSFTFSVFIKADGRTEGSMIFQFGTSQQIRTNFDLTAKTIGPPFFITSGTPLAATIRELDDGWFRLSLSGITGSSGTHRLRIVPISNGQTVYTGSTSAGFILWGAMLEAGGSPSSYIATTSATVQRDADEYTMTSTNFSDWYSSTQGTIFTKSFANNATSQRFVSISDNTGNEIIQGAFTQSSGGGPYFQVLDGGVSQAVVGTESDYPQETSPIDISFAFAYTKDDFAGSYNGSFPSIDLSGTLPTVNQADLGRSSGANYLNGVLSKFYYWNTRLSNGTLQFLSGTGTLSSGNYLWRTNPVSSSNSNALVNWGAGTKTVFSPLPAQATLGSAATADNSSIGTNQYAWANFKKALDQGVVGGVAYSDENTNGIVSTYSLVSTSTAINHVGGVLAPNGDVHFIPYNNVRGQKLSAAGVVSTYSLVYTVANAYGGGVLAGNGDIHFVPTQAARGQKVSASGVVSTYSLVYTTNTAYFGGVLAPNGDIHFVPTQAARGQKVSAAGVVSTYSLVYTTGTGGGYLGGCLAPNGDIHFIPRNAPVGQKISAAGVVSTYSLVYTTSDAYRGGVLSPNGDIHFIPFNAAVGQKISAAGIVSTYALAATFSAGGYNSGVLAPNGDIHFIPTNATVGQRISVNGTPYTYGLVYTIANGFGGGILRPDGSIVFTPQTAAVGQIIYTNPGSPLGLEECLSSYLNKF
jgi:hypothetical protein